MKAQRITMFGFSIIIFGIVFLVSSELMFSKLYNDQFGFGDLNTISLDDSAYIASQVLLAEDGGLSTVYSISV